MDKKSEYLKEISKRGDHYGYQGGIYDLLTWCEKMSVLEVTEEEARRFLENPNAPYHSKGI
ncbi:MULTISPECIES: hypothetical protein [Eubacterium]|uniref:Uncharacterized protein n=1 Tax=Eubacterium barkeri TaxID=1528 RepID=A0A1H3BGE4_EUBBA|nr:hypothetical protein [Eubacterium barkeri]SDX40771.1 hypothetical protein SAMN04488579_10263 [Eubacterium barkeri]